MQDTKELSTKIKTYYITNNLPIPNSVSEYIKSYPPGLSRQVLSSKYGMKCSELVELINETYHKADPKKSLLEFCTILGYGLVTNITTNYRSKDRIDVQCLSCGHINNTTLDSLRGSTKGCVKCTSGNLAWSKREEELRALLFREFEAELISSIPNNQTGYITVKHLPCNTEYTTQLVGIVSPNTKLRGTCPNCRDTDRRVVFEGQIFGSQFELDCYKLIKSLSPEIHVPYTRYFNTDRRWNCDFKIGNIWIEVSNFKLDYKNYFGNIEEKQALVESNNHNFFFIRSLKEMEEIVSILS